MKSGRTICIFLLFRRKEQCPKPELPMANAIKPATFWYKVSAYSIENILAFIKKENTIFLFTKGSRKSFFSSPTTTDIARSDHIFFLFFRASKKVI